MPTYVGFLREGTDSSLPAQSPEEAQRTLERYLAWSEEQERQGVQVGGGGLSVSKGKTLRRHGSEPAVTEGPYTESAEVLGGYLVIETDSLDDAEKLFSTHPHLDFGSIEVRKIGDNGTCEA